MALQTIFIKKKIKYFSFVVLLLIFIFLACLFERNISKPPENLDDGLQNYCGNEVASNFVLSYSAFGKHSWKRFGKNIENVAKGALSSSFYVSGGFEFTMIYIHWNFRLKYVEDSKM